MSPVVDAPQVPRMPSAVWFMTIITFCSMLGFGMIGPALPALAELYGVGAAAAGLAVSGFAFARLITNLSFSGLLKRWRLLVVLIVGLLIQAGCSIVAGLAADYTIFIAFRTISGVGSAAFTVAATAIVLLVAPAAIRGRALSIYITGGSLGTISGPAVGGVFAALDPRLPLIVYGVLLGVGAIIATFALRRTAGGLRTTEVVEDRTDTRRGPSILRALLTDRLFIALLLCQLSVGFVFYGMRTSTLPLHLGALGISLGAMGLYLTLSSVAQIGASSTVGFAADRFPDKYVVGAGLVIAIGALTVFGLFEATPAIILAFVLLGLAGGIMGPASTSLLGQVPLGTSGAAVSLYWSLFDIGGILGPWICGMLADTVGVSWAFVAGGVVLTITLVALLTSPRRALIPATIPGNAEPR